MTKSKRNYFRPLLSMMMAFIMFLGLVPTALAAESVPSGAMKDDAGEYKLYMANGESFVNVGDDEVSAYMVADERFFTEYEDITMELEIRQYNDEGYKVVGSESYDFAALQTFKNQGVYDSEAKTYTFKDIKIKTAEDKDFNEGWDEYCVVKFSRPSWVTEEGKQEYKWTYTGDAKVLGAGVEKPLPIVWCYNLDESSYRGSLIRSILNDLDIEAGTVNNENLNQNIGYLVGWDGYAPVENPYSGESYDVEYLLMGNLTEVQLDDFIEAMQENNIRVNLKSVPTAWTASKTFAELFDIMAEEDEVLKAAVELDKMIYEAETLDEATYGSSPYWSEFKTALDEAIVALSTDAEETGEGAALYENARVKLLNAYLKVTGKTLLDGELELTAEKQEDGTYEVSAKLNGEQTDATFDYNWKHNGSTDKTVTVNGSDLYKINLTITGTGNYYGTMTASLSVPDAPEFDVEEDTDTIKVTVKEQNAKLNTPATEGYVVELYHNGEKVHSQEIKKAGTVTFDGLESETEYTVKVNSYNAVGRSDIVEETVTTLAVEDGETDQDTEGIPGDDDNQDTEGVTGDDDNQSGDNNVENDEAIDNETDVDAETDVDKETNIPQTGDEMNLGFMIVLMCGSLAVAGIALRKN